MEIITVQTKEQLEECLKVRREVFIEEQQVPEELEIDEFDASPESATHLLIRVDGIPSAAGRMRSYSPQTAKLQRIAVLKKLRGKGIGRSLVLALEQNAREQGYTRVMLEAQCHAEEFYHKLGYLTVTSTPFLDAGILHVRMEKSLVD